MRGEFAPMRRALVILVALVCARQTTAAESPEKLSGRAMGTVWTVKYFSAPQRDSAALTREVAARLDELEQIFSTYRPASEISRFNATATTDWVPVSRDMVQVAELAHEISALTEGAFDATVLPLVQTWGFGPQRRVSGIPTAPEIAAARERVNWTRLEARAEPPALRKTRGDVAVDFSSLAKGFASDEIGRLLAAKGIADYFVQVAGDMVCRGRGPDGRPWRVGIEEPREEGRAVAKTLALRDAALSTSGDYRNFFLWEGHRFAHIIDPHSGTPAESSLASVSVIQPSCARSSALATALFVLGPEAAYRLAEREGWACLFILRDGGNLVLRATPGFERLYRETELSSVGRP